MVHLVQYPTAGRGQQQITRETIWKRGNHAGIFSSLSSPHPAAT